jgi:hypothetical protein
MAGVSPALIAPRPAVRAAAGGRGRGAPDGVPWDEGWQATMLGLRSRVPAHTDLLEPRVDAPAFELRGEDGVLRTAGDAPGRVADLTGELSRAPDVWRELRVVAGPEGIVATRPSAATVPGWIYDLWLLERLAERLELEPLPPARIGPRWKVPDGLGRR